MLHLPHNSMSLGSRSSQRALLHARPRPNLNRPLLRLQPLHAFVAQTQASEFRLPNGLVLRHFSAEELNFLYREVLVNRVYLRHGLTIRPGDTVIDVGANTGLFTLLASEGVGPAGRVVALEPLGTTFQLLLDNVAAHAEWCRARGREVCVPELLNCGAGAEGQEEATFTTYSDSTSGWSTMYPDDGEVYDNMQRYIEHLLAGSGDLGGKGGAADRGDAAAATALGQLGAGGGGGFLPEPFLARTGRGLWRLPPLRPLLRVAASVYVRRMLGVQRRWTCRLLPLSRLVREQGLQRIDLLKIDVERAELDVLAGLAPSDWPLVQQIVLEVHDLDGRLEAVRRLLEAAGFSRVVSEQDASLAGSTIFLVYGTR